MPEMGVAEHVYRELFRMVMANEAAPGSRMNIDQLAMQLGASSTPVREALAQLETQGLVTKQRMRGFFVADLPSGEEIDDLWEFRLLVESHAARRAADRTNIALSRRFREELESIRAVRLLDDDYTSFTQFREHDVRFHDLVLEAAANDNSRRAIARINTHNRLLRMRFLPVEGYHAIQEHAEIAEAVQSGDADAAEQAMRAHLVASYERLRKHVD